MKRDRPNFAMGPGGGPQRIVRVKVHNCITQKQFDENRKQWVAGIDRMIAWRKAHGLQ